VQNSINQKPDIMAKRRRDGTWEEPPALHRIRENFTEQKARPPSKN